MKWFVSDGSGNPTSRPNTLQCTLSYGNIVPVILAVGTGITLETYNGVPDALTITTPTSAQLAAFPIGAQVNAEWAEGNPLAVVLRGILLTV
jgi:hypothetical protein